MFFIVIFQYLFFSTVSMFFLTFLLNMIKYKISAKKTLKDILENVKNIPSLSNKIHVLEVSFNKILSQSNNTLVAINKNSKVERIEKNNLTLNIISLNKHNLIKKYSDDQSSKKLSGSESELKSYLVYSLK